MATLYFVGIDTVIDTLGSIHWSSILVAALLVLANSLLSLVRFRSVLSGLGFHPGWRSLFFAHSIGQVSNQIFLNTIGQSLSRAAALAADGVPFSASVIATYWERLQAAAVLLLLSLASVWYLFVNIHFDLLPAGFSLLSVLATLAVVTIVTDGWAMWLERPIFGSGLGAYMHHYLSTTGGPLVIHSVPVWLLAETGLVGLLIVAATFGIALRHAFCGMTHPNTAGWAVGLLVALVTLGAAAIVHDFFFQRSFWFLLGLLAALPQGARATARQV